jgi:predicted secreted Zn-dependent protease
VHQTALRGSSLYKDAIKGASTPQAKSAFSEYMVAWDTSLKGIRRPERETVQQYRARQKKVEDKLNVLQSRLEAAIPGT